MLDSIDSPQDFCFLTNVKDVMYAFSFHQYASVPDNAMRFKLCSVSFKSFEGSAES